MQVRHLLAPGDSDCIHSCAAETLAHIASPTEHFISQCAWSLLCPDTSILGEKTIECILETKWLCDSIYFKCFIMHKRNSASRVTQFPQVIQTVVCPERLTTLEKADKGEVCSTRKKTS